jgi:hypothetical protein
MASAEQAVARAAAELAKTKPKNKEENFILEENIVWAISLFMLFPLF